MDEQPHGLLTDATMPVPGPRFPLKLRIDSADGQPARRFAVDGKPELWISGTEMPNDLDNVAGRRYIDPETNITSSLQTWILPIVFPNFPLAEQAAEVLASALKIIEGLSRIPAPTAADGHRHEVILERFSRKIPRQATCRVCLTTLVEDVDEWWKDPARLTDPGPHFKGTVAEAIEEVVNRGR